MIYNDKSSNINNDARNFYEKEKYRATDRLTMRVRRSTSTSVPQRRDNRSAASSTP